MILKAMRKSPEQRYATAHELASDLGSFLENKPIKAKPPTRRERAVKWSQRHPAVIWAAILFLLATTVVSAFSAAFISSAYDREAAQREIAEAERQRAEAEAERAENNLERARITIRDLVADAAKGLGEWSELTPSLRKKFAEQAFGFYQSMLQEESSDPSLQYETAIGYRSIAALHYANKELQQSETLTNQSIVILERLNNEFPNTHVYQWQLGWSYYSLGLTQFRMNKSAEADAALEKAIFLYKVVILRKPDDEQLVELFKIGISLDKQRRSRGDFSHAWIEELVSIYKDAVSRAPESAFAHAYLGYALDEANRRGEAIVELRKATRLNPKEPYFRNYFGCVLAATGLIDEAIAEFREAIRLNPKAEVFRNNLGRALTTVGLLDEAIAEFREAIRLSPNYPSHHQNLGASLAAQGLRDDAIVACREAVRLKPADAAFNYNYANRLHDAGLLKEATGEYQKAISTWHENIRVRPYDFDTLNRLADMLANCRDTKLRDPVKAVELAKEAVERSPLEGNKWNTLGAALLRSENYPAAVEALQKSCELHGDEPSNYFFLAMANWQLGNRDAARDWHAKAVKWLERRPQIIAGELYYLRAEAENLLGISKPASKQAGATIEKHQTDRSVTSDR